MLAVTSLESDLGMVFGRGRNVLAPKGKEVYTEESLLGRSLLPGKSLVVFSS